MEAWWWSVGERGRQGCREEDGLLAGRLANLMALAFWAVCCNNGGRVGKQVETQARLLGAGHVADAPVSLDPVLDWINAMFSPSNVHLAESDASSWQARVDVQGVDVEAPMYIT